MVIHRYSRIVDAVDWRSALREFVLIVAGVLVALAMSAWWEGRERNQRERTYLLQLLADTRENQRRVSAAIAQDSAAQAAATRLHRFVDSTGPLPPPDSATRLVRGPTFDAAELRPLLGTYRALLEAGDLQLLDRASLRFRLVAYLSSIETAQQVLYQASEQILREQDQYFEALIPLAGRAGPGHPSVLATVRGHPAISTALGATLGARGRRLRVLRSLRAEGAQLVQGLEAEIGVEARSPNATDSVRFPVEPRRGPPRGGGGGPPPP